METPQIVTLLKILPSTSHNSYYSPEIGYHWPVGQQFKVVQGKTRIACQKLYRIQPDQIILKQIGSEEVLVTIPQKTFTEYFIPTEKNQ